MQGKDAAPKRKRVFLGSSREARPHIDVIAEWLEDEGLTPVPWNEPGVFLPGSQTLRRLLELARTGVGAAVFVFAADDLMVNEQAQPRDNVLIEYGLFAASLGEENTIAFMVGEPKKPTNLQGVVHVDFNRHFHAKRQLQAWVQEVSANREGEMGKLFETYVDAALCTEDTHIARNEILDHAEDKRLIPGKYLYDSDVGADQWIGLCSDQTYSYFHDGLRFWGDESDTFVQAIRDEAGDEFDFISLGPGDGQKDLELIRAWARDVDLDVIYYPYDVSLRMISQAVRKIRRSGVPIKLRAVLADFDNLSQMKSVFDARDAPNVIGLLGNSLGNVPDELQFVRNLASLMDVGDLLLLEVRLRGEKGGLSELDKPKARQFYFSPLKNYLALMLDEQRLKSRIEKKTLSKIPGAQSTLIYYDEFTFENKNYSDVSLLCINQYDREKFLTAISNVGFECILEKVDDEESFLVCLMKRVDDSERRRRGLGRLRRTS